MGFFLIFLLNCFNFVCCFGRYLDCWFIFVLCWFDGGDKSGISLYLVCCRWFVVLICNNKYYIFFFIYSLMYIIFVDFILVFGF